MLALRMTHIYVWFVRSCVFDCHLTVLFCNAMQTTCALLGICTCSSITFSTLLLTDKFMSRVGICNNFVFIGIHVQFVFVNINVQYVFIGIRVHFVFIGIHVNFVFIVIYVHFVFISIHVHFVFIDIHVHFVIISILVNLVFICIHVHFVFIVIHMHFVFIGIMHILYLLVFMYIQCTMQEVLIRVRFLWLLLLARLINRQVEVFCGFGRRSP